MPGHESVIAGFKAALTEREIWAVLAYIKSTWPPEIQAGQERLNRHIEQKASDDR